VARLRKTDPRLNQRTDFRAFVRDSERYLRHRRPARACPRGDATRRQQYFAVDKPHTGSRSSATARGGSVTLLIHIRKVASTDGEGWERESGRVSGRRGWMRGEVQSGAAQGVGDGRKTRRYERGRRWWVVGPTGWAEREKERVGSTGTAARGVDEADEVRGVGAGFLAWHRGIDTPVGTQRHQRLRRPTSSRPDDRTHPRSTPASPAEARLLSPLQLVQFPSHKPPARGLRDAEISLLSRAARAESPRLPKRASGIRGNANYIEGVLRRIMVVDHPERRRASGANAAVL